METCYKGKYSSSGNLQGSDKKMDKKWLKQQLDARGRGAQAALAAHLGLSASVTNKLIKGDRRIMADEADRIRQFLEAGDGDGQSLLPLGLTKGPTTRPAAGRSAGPEGIPQAPLPARAAPGLDPDRLDIPVWASVAAGDEDGTMLLTDSPIDYIRRSETMVGVANPFAFYIVGDSMLERFAQGDQAVVNPSLPLRPGDDCIFINLAADGTQFGLVKRLLRSSVDHWRVRQLNPRRDFDLSKRKWSRAFRIAETRHRG
jgi:hypothetical protein